MSDCDESILELWVRDECPMESLGETDIAMLEDSDERFLLDSIEMLLLGYSVEDCVTPPVELSIREDCSLKTIEESRRVLLEF